jgi:hypothetical protein
MINAHNFAQASAKQLHDAAEAGLTLTPMDETVTHQR